MDLGILKTQEKSSKSQNPIKILKVQVKSRKSQNYVYEYMKCADITNLSEIKMMNIFVLMFQTELVLKTVQPTDLWGLGRNPMELYRDGTETGTK